MSGEKYTNKFCLNGKNAIVTGATGILGKYFCRGLAEAGANIVVLDQKEETSIELARELEDEYGVKAIGVECDVSDKESVKESIKKITSAWPQIHILHNNAATKSSDLKKFFAATEDYDLQTWKEVMQVNVDGMFLMAQAVGKNMLQFKEGSIIQTSSIYGVLAPDQRIYSGSEYMGEAINTPAVYSVSKSGVIGLTKYLSTLWASQGIRVNTLVPGGVESGQNEVFKKNYSNRVPMARMANPEEMVTPLIFLASEAASYITGQTIMVDGGLSVW